MRAIARILLLVALVTLNGPVLGAAEPDEPRIGLALSGGGARGSAHIGVIRALEEAGVKIDLVAGTSMGAIIGALYASGHDADAIEEILVTMDWETALTDRPARIDRTMRLKELESRLLVPYRLGFNNGEIQLPLGVIEGQHLDQVFHEILRPVIDIRDFDKLQIPFRAVATDLVSGEQVVLSKGSLTEAVRASMSVPGVFAPVKVDGRLLVDGGMSNNLPVSVLREMGADIVIAVDISSPLLTEKQMTSVLSVTEQLTNFLTRRTTEAQIALLGEEDLLIVPDLGNFSSANFNAAAEIVVSGYEAAVAHQDRLAMLANVHVAPVQRPGPPDVNDYIVQFVEIENGSVLNDEIIRSRLDVTLGQPLDTDALAVSLDQIYSLDQFRSVTYDLVSNEAGENGIVIRAAPREWGPNYLQFGIELTSDFSGGSNFTIETGYTRNALNSLGGQLFLKAAVGRVDALEFDFYQPIDTRAKWYLQPFARVSRESYDYWEEGDNIAELELKGWGVGVGIGRNFSTTDRVRMDYQFGKSNASVLTGQPGLGQEKFDIGEVSLQYLHDSLDSNWFPTKGMEHRLQYRYATEGLGASADYQQASALGAFVFSVGRNTGLLRYELGYSFDDAAPIERWYRLGGLGRLSGLAPNQLLGRQAALTTLAYYYRLNDFQLVPAYAGATLEAGNVWSSEDEIGFDDLRYSGSLFIGAETPIGPIYFAVGHSDNGDTGVYFYLGDPFRDNLF